jgi:hypothetical protein
MQFLDVDQICDELLDYVMEDLEKDIMNILKKTGPRQTYLFLICGNKTIQNSDIIKVDFSITKIHDY